MKFYLYYLSTQVLEMWHKVERLNYMNTFLMQINIHKSQNFHNLNKRKLRHETNIFTKPYLSFLKLLN